MSNQDLRARERKEGLRARVSRADENLVEQVGTGW